MSDQNQNDPTKSNATPPPEAAPAAAPSPEEPGTASRADALAAARAEAAAAHERYMRSVADLENFRKRTLREKDELRQFAAASVVEDLIPILDSLGLAASAARQQGSAEAKTIADGVAMVLEQFKGALGRHGMKEINPAGQVFDPNQHECISHQPHAEVGEEKVIQVARLGYSLNGRLLRPASVIVSSGPAQGEAKA